MSDSRLPRGVVAGVASAVVAFVAAFAIVADPTGSGFVYATLLLWPVLVVAFAAANAEPGRLPRFAAVFCGSLVGLSVLFGVVVDYRLLGVGLETAATTGLALPVNPVMSVLVGGALGLSYCAVFRWDAGEDTRAA